MNADLDLKKIVSKIEPVAQRLLGYLWLITLVLFVAAYSFLLVRINTLTAAKPSDESISERLKTVPRPRIDERAADKMQQLEDQNVKIQTLFNEARKNPFAE